MGVPATLLKRHPLSPLAWAMRVMAAKMPIRTADAFGAGRFYPWFKDKVDSIDREGNGTHSSILAWEIPWTEEPGGLQSMGSLRVGHD